MRFDAKCNAKTSVLTSIFYCCGCKFGTNFLQREMQKHSKLLLSAKVLTSLYELGLTLLTRYQPFLLPLFLLLN